MNLLNKINIIQSVSDLILAGCTTNTSKLIKNSNHIQRFQATRAGAGLNILGLEPGRVFWARVWLGLRWDFGPVSATDCNMKM